MSKNPQILLRAKMKGEGNIERDFIYKCLPQGLPTTSKAYT